MYTKIVAWAIAGLVGAAPPSSTALPAGVDHDEYRAAARQSLREYGVSSDVASLLKALTDDARPSVRIISADLLASMKEQQAVPILRSALAHEQDENVRAHLGKDLLDLEGEGAHALLRDLLTHIKAQSDRIYVAGALAGLGDFTAYADVLSGMESTDPRTQWHADSALSSFVAKCGSSCGLSPAPVDVALRLLNHPDHSRRFSALVALSHRLADPRVVAAIRATAETDKDETLRKTARVFLELAALQKQQVPGDHQ